MILNVINSKKQKAGEYNTSTNKGAVLKDKMYMLYKLDNMGIVHYLNAAHSKEEAEKWVRS